MPLLPLLGLGVLIAGAKSKNGRSKSKKKICKGKRSDGRACGSFAMQDEQYCRSHLRNGLFFKVPK